MTQASPNPAASAKQALSAFENGQFELAIEGFREAREGFIAAGNPLQGAEMANNLAVALVQAGRHQAALESLSGTFQIFLDHGDWIKAAQALGNEAAAYEGLNDWERAESLYQQAAERFADLDDPDNQQYTLQALSRIRLRQGRALEAVNTMQGALESKKHTNWSTRLAQKILSLPSRMLKP
jgi:tetratricopeptide (TPR) repeat protein